MVTYVVNPEHRLHEPVLFPQCGSAASAAALRASTCASRPVHPERPRGGPPQRGGVGAGAPRRCACRAASAGLHRRLSTWGCSSAIKERLPEMHVHGFQRRWRRRCRRAPTPSGSRCGSSSPALFATPAWGRCRGRRRRSSTTASGSPPVPRQGPHRRVGGGVWITAHELGLRATHPTMMMGHIDVALAVGRTTWRCCAKNSRRTGGFTEFVPLPFVHMGSPIFLQGKCPAGVRRGTRWCWVHAVGRIALDRGWIDNIQVVVGEARPRRRAPRSPRRRLQRPGRDADGREHHLFSQPRTGSLSILPRDHRADDKNAAGFHIFNGDGTGTDIVTVRFGGETVLENAHSHKLYGQRGLYGQLHSAQWAILRSIHRAQWRVHRQNRDGSTRQLGSSIARRVSRK